MRALRDFDELGRGAATCKIMRILSKTEPLREKKGRSPANLTTQALGIREQLGWESMRSVDGWPFSIQSHQSDQRLLP